MIKSPHFLLFLLYLPQVVMSQESSSPSQDSTAQEQAAIHIPYGELSRSLSTNSYHVLTAKDFAEGPYSHPLELLKARLPGIEVFPTSRPGGGSELRLRMGNGLSFYDQALIILDGIPLDNRAFGNTYDPLALLNPHDIASFTVLQDAEATAIYGARAQYGAILIRTQEAESGGKLRVNYRTGLGISRPVRLTPVLDEEAFRAFVSEKYGENHPAFQALGSAQTDWQGEIFRSGSWNDHHISMQGGLKHVPYRISLGYTDETGILKTGRFQRLSTDVRLSPTFWKKQVKVDIQLRNGFEKTRLANESAMRSALSMDPTQPVYDPGNDFGGYFTYTQANGSPNPIATPNPLALLEQTENSTENRRTLAAANLNFTPQLFPGFGFHLRTMYDHFALSENQMIPIHAAFSSDGRGFLGAYDENKTNFLLETWIRYKKDWGNFAMDISTGLSRQQITNQYNFKEAFFDSIPIDAGEVGAELSLGALWASLQMNWKERVMLSVSMRRESPFYALDVGTIPGISLAWKVWDKKEGKLNLISLRAGHKVTIFNDSRSNISPLFASAENMRASDAGIDLVMMKHRLRASVGIYDRQMKGVINQLTVPVGSNLTNSIFANIGESRNYGLELRLGSSLSIADKAHLSLEANIWMGWSQVVDLTYHTTWGSDSVVTYAIGGIRGGVGNTAQILAAGHGTRSFYLYEQVYDASGIPLEGLYVDQNQDGLITSYDRYIASTRLPNTRINLRAALEFRNWEIASIASIRLGNRVYNQEMLGGSTLIYNTTGFLSNIHANAAEINFAQPQFFSDHFLQQASFFRMENIRLGYRFPQAIKKKYPISVACVGQNIFTITPYKGRNPDLPWGIDDSFYPVVKTIMLTVNMKI